MSWGETCRSMLQASHMAVVVRVPECTAVRTARLSCRSRACIRRRRSRSRSSRPVPGPV
ncbi:hypothetical protein E9229_003160 [Paeniglutamicibacter cryotolerans]|uniref:Uncharacterized protein n=1 Tax=Paeniglutamicibacter cryotolerans TaxID=670079 RepID=A0A839QMU8_9MICC|nr:hypothetical protein [Paeniglutamicibacter cryotolerans]